MTAQDANSVQPDHEAESAPTVSHLLIVDDEQQLLVTLQLSLTKRGFQVSTAADGTTALQLVRDTHPDLVVLDLGLPDIGGLEVIRRLHRESPGLPVMVLSARSGSYEKVVALDLGAVDYIRKPFDTSELAARIRAIARRVTARHPNVVSFGAVTVDLAERTVIRVDGEETRIVHLTATEWRMLEILLANPDVLVRSGDLLTRLRGDSGHTNPSYLRLYMAQLRHKLEATPSRPRYLLTEPGLGYRFRP
jgi:two-component system KDP operon response regulator KdpE